MAPFGFGDLDGTNFYEFYGGFEEIGVLDVEAAFTCLQYFGLDVQLGIDVKITNSSFLELIK